MLDITDPTIFVDANAAFCQLIERGQLVPENGELKIELYGELAALLKLGTEPKNEHPQAKSEGVQISMVAGARNRRYLHLDFAIV
ncbi:MAG: hypothetical protein VW712_07670 [Paracoccaceae bacterium]|jgi:hypothetical protein